MIKAIFLDRDGTINEEPADEIVDSIDKVKILPNTITGLKLLKNTDFKIFVITNQIGIGFGRLTIKKFNEINNYVLNQLKKEGINIEETFFCPHKPGDKCNCRKPKPGMIEKAEQKYNVDLLKSFVIGDRESDIILGKNAGCKTIMVKTGYGSSINAVPDYIADDLLDAVKFILQNKQ